MAKTTKQALADQLAQAQRDLAAMKPAQAIVPAKAVLPTVPDTRSAQETYLDEISPSGIVGRLIKFDGKAGKFVFADTDEMVVDTEDFVCLADETLVSWIKFNDGDRPTRIGGLLYHGFALPARDDLGDHNETDWPIGLAGRPEDPWKNEMLLVLRRPASLELATFCTLNKTGRRAVGTLLKHYNRLRVDHPGSYPVIRMKAAGYNDKRFGWVPTPAFIPVGMTAGHTAAVPDTSLAADMNDALPF